MWVIWHPASKTAAGTVTTEVACAAVTATGITGSGTAIATPAEGCFGTPSNY